MDCADAGRNFGVEAVPAAEGQEKKALCVPVGFEIPSTTSEENKTGSVRFHPLLEYDGSL